jgi:hypothetical protein
MRAKPHGNGDTEIGMKPYKETFYITDKQSLYVPIKVKVKGKVVPVL